MAKITYTDKDKTGVSPVNKWRDTDANEVKASVNALYDINGIGVFAALQDSSMNLAKEIYQPILGVFTNSPMVGFERAGTEADPKIQYIGTESGYFEIDLHSCFMSDANNDTVTIAIKKNDTVLDVSEMKTFCKNLNQLYNLSLTVVVDLETDDTIQLVYKTTETVDYLGFEKLTTTIRPFII